MAAVETVRPGGDRIGNTTHDLYRQYGRQIYAYCFHKLRSREEAEDAVQTTFMNAFRALQRGTSTQFEQAWLFKIAQNVCFARQSSSSRRRLHEVSNDFEVLQEVVPAREGEGSLELIGIEEALENMPENQRRAILLREWQGLSYREIGEELQLSQAAVEMLIFRARRSLAGALEQPQPSKAKRRAARGATFGGLISALKTLFGGGAAIKAVAAAAAAVVVVGESAQHTVVHRTPVHGSKSSAATAVRPATTKSVAAQHVAPAEPSRVAVVTASAERAHAQRKAAPGAAAVAAKPTAAQSHHSAGGTGHAGTSAPAPDVEPAPVAAPAPAPAPPAVHPAVPAAPAAPPAAKVTKSVPPVTTTTTTSTPPPPPVTVTLPTLATSPDPGNANGHGKDKSDPPQTVTTPVVTEPDAPPAADHGNGHGKDKSDPTPTDPAPAPAPAVQPGNGNGPGNGHGKP